jgi:hypothetical protein
MVNKPVSHKGGWRVGGRDEKSGVCRNRCVSRAKLDVALRPGDESFRVANNRRGIATLVKRLKKLSLSRILLEGSGGL